MFGQVTFLLVADEAFTVPHMLCSFTVGKVDFINVRGIGV